MSRFPSPPEFFIDRSLGRYLVPATLRTAGWRLRTHAEVFGSRDQDVPDSEWLELCGVEGLAVLTKDRRIRYRPQEIAAIRQHRIKAFVLSSGNLRAAEQSQRFLDHRERIEELCSEDGRFVYAVQMKRIVRVFPE